MFRPHIPQSFFRLAPVLALPLLLGLSACAVLQPASPPSPPPASSLPPSPPPVTSPGSTAPAVSTPSPAATTTAEPAQPLPLTWLTPVRYGDLPAWRDDDLTLAWQAFQQSCRGLRGQAAWTAVCQAAEQLALPDAGNARAFFEQHFTPYQVRQAEGGTEGLVTGYYEPLLRGSRYPTHNYRYALYGQPDDLLVVDLAGLYPELKNLRLRGRLQGNRVVPYFSRTEIDNGQAPLRGKELLWVDDPVELFFLQIQGSGRVRLETGEMVRVGYADQNGHPYRSIGKWLVDQGELTLDKASMQGIKDWAVRNPDKLADLLRTNPSYVFFRELPNGLGGPLGALGVPLTAGRSIAVDPRAIPLGAPVWLATTWPYSSEPLVRLVMAQDTGGAIRGNVRADFFWGFGDEAGAKAGAMKQRGRMWVLLPKDYPVNGNAGNKLGLK